MKILVFPMDKNPYQQLLYRAIYNNNSDFIMKYAYTLPIIGALFFPFTLLIRRVQGYKIIHIHWLPFYINTNFPGSNYISYLLSLFCINCLKLLRYKVIWTVHNVLPHENKTSNDKAVSVLISRLADKIIVHSKYTIIQMEDIGLDVNNIHIIPHGNYHNVYKSNASIINSRDKLGLKSKDKVVLFFGNVRPYKGVELLLKVFSANNQPNTKLVIAGICRDELLKKQINNAVIKNTNILFRNSYIPDDDVQIYFKSADIVCLPFKSITTSGSILLALTFGKPVIAPNIGAIQDIPKDVGALYDPSANNALGKALITALSDSRKLKKMAKASIKYSETLSWNKIAAETYKVYEEVLRTK